MYLREEERPALEEDEFFVRDMIGMDVVMVGVRILGWCGWGVDCMCGGSLRWDGRRHGRGVYSMVVSVLVNGRSGGCRICVCPGPHGTSTRPSLRLAQCTPTLLTTQINPPQKNRRRT